MRRILVLISFLLTLRLSAAGVIVVSPARPTAGQPVTFTLTGVTPAAGSQTWSFGDGSSASGSSIVTHTYARARQYRVRVTFALATASSSSETWVTVSAPYQTGPSAPFNLTSITLRWKDGRSIVTVPRGFEGLTAYADLKFEGTGPFQAQWLVDGQVLRTVSQILSFAGRATIDSGTVPALHTNIPGPHDVTLRILSPSTSFRIPVIRYEVSPTAQPAALPTVESIHPPAVHAGEEVELQVMGQNFTEDMRLDFGSGITMVGPVALASPMAAAVKVFVPPTAKPGFHSLSMVKGKDRLASKARLEVLGAGKPQKSTSGSMPCPDSQHFEKAVVTLERPAWKTSADAGTGGAKLESIVPTLTDFTVFKWSEPAPGAAEYFELRFYDRRGKRLILSQRLPGGTKEWSVPADFVPKLVKLAAQIGPLMASGTKLAAALPAPAAGSQGTSTEPLVLSPAAIKGPKPALAGGQAAKAMEQAKADAEYAAHLAEISDVLWNVVGIREYTCTPKADPKAADASAPPSRAGVKLLSPLPGKLVGPETAGEAPGARSRSPLEEAPEPVKLALEVEASEFWPLRLPGQALGISPATCTMALPGSTLQAVPVAGGGSGDVFPGDPFVVSGSFSLKGSPYGFKPSDTHKAEVPPGSSLLAATDGCTFDNVFVDWGDGTELKPLTVRIENPYVGDVNSGMRFTLDASGASELNGRLHAYTREGSYNVRVFMLSEDDVQLAGLKADASKAMASKGILDSAYGALLKTALAFPKVPAPSSTGQIQVGGVQLSSGAVQASLQVVLQPSIQQILARAYVLFCRTVDIRPFPDHCALKPLELVSVELSFDKPSSKAKIVAPSVPALAKGPAPKGATSVKASQAVLSPDSAPKKPGAAGLKPDIVTSGCNEAFTARTVVKYQGHGTVKVVWKVDGEVVFESRPTEATTPVRTGLTKAQAEDMDCSKVPPTEIEINMPDYLPVSTPGFHILTAEAMVVPDARKVDLGRMAAELAGLGAAGKGVVSPDTLAALTAASGSSKGPKFGLLNPVPAPGMPHMVYVNDVAPGASKALGLQMTPQAKPAWAGMFRQPPYFVESGRKVYKVESADSKEVCSIDFPTKGGSFRVTDLAKNVKTEVVGGVTRMTGTGKLKVALRAGDDIIVPLAVPLTLSQWEVDGTTVTKGDVDLTGLGAAVNLPGTQGHLDSLKGKVQGKGKTEDMLARLSLKPADATLTLRSDESRTPGWSVERPLSSEGDFYAEGLDLPETFVGRTPWIMKSQGGVVLDYSHREGQGPAGQGITWVGVRLKKLALQPFSFQLVGQSPAFPLVDTWYLGSDGGSDGLHGKVDFKNWEGAFQDGSIKVGTMHFEALGGQNYKAAYKDTEVKVPWFATPIKGDIAMSKTGDGFIWTYEDVKAAAMPTVVNGGFTLEPANLCFTNEKNIAWTVMGDAVLDFKADGRPFASFTLDRFCYRFDGRASFEQDIRTKTLPLNAKSALGDTQADIRNVVVTMPTSGNSVVNFDFNTSLRLSDSPLLPAADVAVGYRLNKMGAAYSAPPAATAPFELAMAFPMGSPTVEGKIHPVYSPGTGGGSSTRYTGEVDLGMFGGPPFKTQFVLGYQGKKDYFLCRVDIPLGPSGIALYPGLLMLYKIHGGLGYNFGVDAFKDSVGILDAQPDMKGNALFSAGMRVGSADRFAYMLDGTLTISTGGAARMDYDAWLLTTNHGGQGQFRGWFQYANESFDGKLWGGLDMLGGLVQFSMGNSEANAAVDLHLASDSWHIYAGQKNGQRIKAKVIAAGSDSYLMLGSQEGFLIGGAQNFYLGVGDSSVASVYAKAYLDMGLQVTPQPKLIGDFGAGMSAGVCVFGVCVSGGVDAAVHAEALPLDVRATANLDLPWPLGDVTFTVHM